MRQLRSYQKKALRFSLKVKHPALFMEMRLGKTLVTIRSAILKGYKKILVVCPYSAFMSWEEELQEENQKYIYSIVGTKKVRLELLNKISRDKRITWSIINKEGFLVIPEIRNIKWDCLVWDESHYLKNPQSKISKFYVNNFRDVKGRYCLTGTPAPENELEYFQQLIFLDENNMKFKNYWEYRHACFVEGFHNYKLHAYGRKYLENVLSKNCFFLTRKEVNLGGEKIYIKRSLVLSPKLKKVYKTIVEEFVLEGDGIKLDMTIFAGQKWIWLRRLCGGFAEKKLVHKLKCNEILEFLRGELKSQQLVIWCAFTREIEYLNKFLKQKKFKVDMIYGKVKQRDRIAIRKKFNSKKIQILIAQPETLKLGVNLSISDTAIYYSSPTGLETRLQSEDRIIGDKKSSSLIIDLLIKDSVEEDILISLMRKETQQELMRRVMRRIQNEAA